MISDEAGHDRILLGAPVPESHDRLRRDARTASLVFVDALGHDRVVVGAAPPPIVGGEVRRRVGEGHGLTFYDPKGSERGGIGFLDSGRAVVALDYPERDAIGMMVDDHNGFAGLLVAHRPPADQASIIMGVQNGSTKMTFSDPAGHDRAELAIEGQEAPTWKLRPAGRPGTNLQAEPQAN